MNKKTSQKIHAIRRARQRYNVELSDRDYKLLGKQIRSGRSIFIEKKSNTRTVHDVIFKGVLMRAVYNKERKNRGIVTFLHR